MPKSIDSFITQISQNHSLTDPQAYECLATIFTGTIPQDRITTLLHTLHTKGESVSEIIGFARAMKDAMVKVHLPLPLLDTCGTGGTGKDRFNISTAVALLLNTIGVSIAKHGNRGSTKPNGSFDFLEALNIPFGQTPQEIQAYFNRHNACFLFARAHHPAMKYVTPSRTQLAHPTIFNILGPLCNPAQVTHQVIGTQHQATAEKLAHAIQHLGTTRTWIIVGGGGADDISPLLPSLIIKVTPDTITQESIDPKTLSLPPIPSHALTGGTATENAHVFHTLLTQQDSTHPLIQHILLNASVGLAVTQNTSITDEYHTLNHTFSTKNTPIWDQFTDKQTALQK